MSFKRITAELDEIAGQLQGKGLKRMAASVDVVANTLEGLTKARRASRRKADQSMGLSFPESSGGMNLNPGVDADEMEGNQDSYTAPKAIQHRIPVGNDAVLRATRGVASPGEIDLEFAQEDHQISLQAKKRRSKKRRATPRDDYSEGDADYRSTSGLPQSGDEDEDPPVDKNQEGDVLPFYGTDPAGSLHGGGRSGKKRRNMKTQAKAARFTLLREASNVEVMDPDAIESSDPGDEVEADQSLGGLGYGPGYDDSETVVSMPGEMGVVDEAGIVGAEDDDMDDDDYEDDDMDDDDDDDDDMDDDDDDMEDDTEDEDDDDYDDEDDYEDDDDDDDYDDDDDDTEDEESAGAYAAIEYP